MNTTVIFFICLLIILFVLSLFLTKNLKSFNLQYKNLLKNNEELNSTLKEFSYDIHFNPPVSEINIENPYNCTGDDLKECKLSDYTTCFGCKSLISTCTHFDNDTEYIDAYGNKFLIPANIDPDSGYCLSTMNPSQKCNSYHGNLVLVQLDSNSKNSALFCDCKNPGYIGKLQLDGSCEDVFICDGKIKDLNVEFENIQCVCSDGYKSERINDVPICQIMTVLEYDNYSSLRFTKDTISSSFFSTNISGNFKGDSLINPCKYCILTGKYLENGLIIPTDDGGYQCSLNKQKNETDLTCIPIRRSKLGRLLKGKEGPDGIIAINWKYIFTYGYINNLDYQNAVAVFYGSDNEKLCETLELDNSKLYAFNLYIHQLHYPGHFGQSHFTIWPKSFCTAVYPYYHCEFTYGKPPYYENIPVVTFNNTIYPMYNGIDIPGAFLWKKERWRDMELRANTNISARLGLKNNVPCFQTHPWFEENETIKFLFWGFVPQNGKMVAFLTDDYYDYTSFRAAVIPRDENTWVD